MPESCISALCRIPIARKLRDVSTITLFLESGYLHHRDGISESALEKYLRAHPELVQHWVRFSEDQRCTPSWYLLPPVPRIHDHDQPPWVVGYMPDSDSEPPQKTFPNPFSACAFFIKREAEELSGLVNGAS